jgi:hypothetical protein
MSASTVTTRSEDRTVCPLTLKQGNTKDSLTLRALPTAKLAISIARKMNALIFLVPEDIVDVRPRLVRVYVRAHIKRTCTHHMRFS